MKISLITPAGKQSRNGNRTTAVRWWRILRNLGHQVTVDTDYHGEPADLMIAVHAWRSAPSIDRFRQDHPNRPLVVALSGTDIYKFQHSHPETTLQSMQCANALVCLHALVHRSIPKRFGKKLHVIYQSSPPPTNARTPSKRWFDICVVGHLRDEKDPLRAAQAAALLPPESRLRVIHLGKAHDRAWAAQAKQEMKRNARYIWRGEVPGWMVRRQFSRSHLMVLSSVMEGGANVLSEAVVAGLPVVASDIEGSVGLLGDDYAGYYPVGDTAALAEALHRAESEPAYLRRLSKQCRARASLFRPAHEQRAWRDLIRSLT